MSEFSLSKSERLCSRKAIGNLFADGESFFVFPLKVVFLKTTFEDERPVKAAFSVSKRNFKRAVKRNHLKRLMRETYRLNKSKLVDLMAGQGEQLAVMFIYAVKEEKDYPVVERSMQKALQKLDGILRSGEANSQS